MKCPNCEHVSETALLRCAQCGHVFDRHALETHGHLEFLLSWLDDQAAILGPQSHERLRRKVVAETAAAKAALGLPAPLSPSEAEAIARESALLQAARDRIREWETAGWTSPVAAQRLVQHLANEIKGCRRKLAGRPILVEPPSDLDVLDHALTSLPEWAKHAQMSTGAALSLSRRLDDFRTEGLTALADKLSLVEATLEDVPSWVEETGLGFACQDDVCRHLAGQADLLRKQLAGRHVEPTSPGQLEVVDFGLESLPLWVEQQVITSREAPTLRAHLREIRQALLEPAPAPAVQVAAAIAEVEQMPVTPPPPPAKPAPPPIPPTPPIDWAKVRERAWEFITSGAALRALLYLGAFMIVVAAAILVVRFWDDFHTGVQLLCIASVPTAFYVAGWGVRAGLESPEAGDVLSGIGALLVAVDLAAIYQYGDLGFDLYTYWLGSSALCTVIYFLTAWRLPREFFGYVALVGLNSTLLASTFVLDLPFEWRIAALAALAVPTIEGAARLGRAPDRWRGLAVSARRLSLILIPATQVAVLFVPGTPAFGWLAVYLLATLGYGLLGWRFPAAVFPHTAVWSSILTVGFALWGGGLPWQWYGAISASLALPCALTSRWLDQRTDTIPPDSETLALWDGYFAATEIAGFVLLGAGLIGGVVVIALNALWPGVVALCAGAVVLGGFARLYEDDNYVWLSAGLFIAPFSLAGARWLHDYGAPQRTAWLMASWSGLALGYLGLAVVFRKADRYVRWLNLWGHFLAPAACIGLVVNFGQTVPNWFAGPSLVALGGAILVYVASAVIHDSGRHPALSEYLHWLAPPVERTVFLWPAGGLVPAWVAVAWVGNGLETAWLGPLLAGLALAYVGLGQLLALRRTLYRLPLHVYAYPLAVAAIAVAVAGGDYWALLVTLYVVTGLLAALGFVYRRVAETVAAAVFFIWPFQLSLEGSGFQTHSYALAYALLAALIYFPLGILLQRRKPVSQRPHALAVYAVGYAVSVYAVGASLLGLFDFYRPELPWVGVTVPLIVAGFYVYSLYRFRVPVFGWAATLVLSIAFGQTLDWLRIPYPFVATAWVGLAFVYLLAERLLARLEPAEGEAWFGPLRLPLGLGSAVVAVLGLALTAGDTATALYRGLGFAWDKAAPLYPLILAQGLAVGLLVLASWLYRSRWPLFIEPVLAVFPVTLVFINYGAFLFGQPLKWPQFALVWLGLALVHLLAGTLLDPLRVRYAHGLYSGGYALGLFALFWSIADRVTLLYTLGSCILLALASQVLVHFGRNRSFDDLIRSFWGERENKNRQAARTAFLFFGAYAFPIWLSQLLVLIQRLFFPPLAQPWRVGILALVPPLYAVLGLTLRQLRSRDQHPIGYSGTLFGAACLLAAISAGVVFPITIVQALTVWEAFEFIATAWVGLAFVYLLTERLLARSASAEGDAWFQPVRWALGLGSAVVAVLGLALTAGDTATTLYRGLGFAWDKAAPLYPFILAQGLAVGLLVLASWLYRSRWPLFIEPVLAVFPVTLAFIDYGAFLFGQPLKWPQFALVWLGLALVHLLAGALLDPLRVRYAHGLYSGGYALGLFALFWSIADRVTLLYALGICILSALASQVLVQFGRHRSFDDLIRSFWGERENKNRQAARTAFLFFGAYAFPIWLSQLLVLIQRLFFPPLAQPWRVGILALVPPLYAVLGLTLRRVRSRDDRPIGYSGTLFGAGCLLTAITAGVIFPIALVQALTVWGAFEFVATAWVGLAFVYLLTERLLARSASAEGDAWFQPVRWALGLGSAVAAFLGLALTAGDTATALYRGLGFAWDKAAPLYPFILAQGLAVGLLVLASWLYRSRWPLFIEPVLTVFPVTLAAINYGAFLFGQPLIWVQFGLVWLGLALVHLLAGALLDPLRVRFAHGLFLGGYALSLFALFWSIADRVTLLYTMGICIMLALASQALVHFGRHRSFDDLIGAIWGKRETTARRAARTVFLFLGSYGIPIWLVLLLAYARRPLPQRGVALALIAPVYVAAGLALRRARGKDRQPPAYTWPLYSAGYALTAIGAMMTVEDALLAIYVLALDTAVYAVSAYVFRQAFWLYLSNTLLPVVSLIVVHYHADGLPPAWVAGVFMALAFLYFGAGSLFQRPARANASEGINRFALPFYAPAYLLSGIALAVASGETYLALAVFSAGVALYALSLWWFRESLFLYPAAWLAAVPYYLAMTLTPLPRRWYSLGWMPLIIGYLLLGRFVFHRPWARRLFARPADSRAIADRLAAPTAPFYAFVYVMSVSMMVVGRNDALVLSLAFAAGALLYFGSAALFHRPAWLYPGLLAAHFSLLAYLYYDSISRPGAHHPRHYVTLPFHLLTWAVALIGYGFTRWLPAAREGEGTWGTLKLGKWTLELSRLPVIGHLVTRSWAQPFFLFATVDVILWQLLALNGVETTIILATGHMVLLGLFATLWQDTALAYGSLAALVLAASYRLYETGMPLAQALLWIGGVGFGLYLLGSVAAYAVARAKETVRALTVWPRPSQTTAVILSSLAAIGALPMLPTHLLEPAGALAFAGALHLTIAYRRRSYGLGYFGMGVLQSAWVLFLLGWGGANAQWYAIPAGLYFVGIGALERRRERRPFTMVIECFGLAVLLLTSFAQSLNGTAGFPHFLILLVEGLLVIWWGASRRTKIPFFIGVGASVLNVVAQTIVLVTVHAVNRWLILLGVGVLLLSAGVFGQWKREQIIARTAAWREALDTWE